MFPSGSGISEGLGGVVPAWKDPVPDPPKLTPSEKCHFHHKPLKI